jgi:dihydroorotate dehydrogenase
MIFMYQSWIGFRNSVIGFMYRNIAKPFFFLQDPEEVHDRAILTGKFLGSTCLTRFLTRLVFNYSNEMLEQNLLGIRFSNPVGLAAGFDKNAELASILPEVGFGFLELGSMTFEAYEGNTKPRLKRYKKSQSLWVNYGLKNVGIGKILLCLKRKQVAVPLGISVARTNAKKTADLKIGIKDVQSSFKVLGDFGTYHTINISCPNNHGGEPFTEAKRLEALLKEIPKSTSPRFLKLPAEVSKKELDALATVAKKYGIKGFICSNLGKKDLKKNITEGNVPEHGGISGKPVYERALENVRYLYEKYSKDFVIVFCGGIFTAEDAYKAIRAGASLLQLITGMIYRGPGVVSEINQGLVHLLQRDGFNSISQAIGVDAKN